MITYVPSKIDLGINPVPVTKLFGVAYTTKLGMVLSYGTEFVA